MAEISAQTHVIVDVFLETIVYGFSIFLFPLALWVLCRRRKFCEINHTMLSITCLLFSLSTTHLGINLHHLIHWFAHNGDVDFHGLSPDNAALGIIYPLQTLLGDAVVIYRCYVVWQSIFVVLLPIASWLALLATIAALTTVISQHGTYYLFSGQGAILLNLFYAFSLITNFISTGLLAYRIWRVNREASNSQKYVMKTKIYPIMIISLDAGFLYTATLFASLIVFARKSPAVFLVSDLLVPTIALTFYMVIIRVGLVSSKHTTTTFSTTEGSSGQRHLTTVEVGVGTGTSGLTSSQLTTGSRGDQWLHTV